MQFSCILSFFSSDIDPWRWDHHAFSKCQTSVTQCHGTHTSQEKRPSYIGFVSLFQEPEGDLCKWIHPPCWPYCLGWGAHPMKKEPLWIHKNIMWTTTFGTREIVCLYQLADIVDKTGRYKLNLILLPEHKGLVRPVSHVLPWSSI